MELLQFRKKNQFSFAAWYTKEIMLCIQQMVKKYFNVCTGFHIFNWKHISQYYEMKLYLPKEN